MIAACRGEHPLAARLIGKVLIGKALLDERMTDATADGGARIDKYAV